MSQDFKKRFYTLVAAVKKDVGFVIQLDGGNVRTPAGAVMALSNENLARAIANEWDTQEKHINLEKMPLSRLAFAAIDQVGPNRASVIAEIAAFGDTDLILHRAEAPAALAARQAKAWDPLCDWSAQMLGASLLPVCGILAAPQPQGSRAALEHAIEAHCDFGLSALHKATKLCGSVIIALAIAKKHLNLSEAWEVSRIDEAWQSEHWGADAEFEEAAHYAFEELAGASAYFDLLNTEADASI